MGVEGLIGYESIEGPKRYGFYDPVTRLAYVSKEPDRLVVYKTYSFGFYTGKDVFKESLLYVPLVKKVDEDLLWE